MSMTWNYLHKHVLESARSKQDQDRQDNSKDERNAMIGS